MLATNAVTCVRARTLTDHAGCDALPLPPALPLLPSPPGTIPAKPRLSPGPLTATIRWPVCVAPRDSMPRLLLLGSRCMRPMLELLGPPPPPCPVERGAAVKPYTDGDGQPPPK